MATLSVVATAEPDAVPPRVRVDVTDVGNSPVISSVTVTRTQAGKTVALRSNDGAPLQLESDGTSRSGTIFDSEALFGVPATYSTVQQSDRTSDEVTVDASLPWLVHPGLPNLSQPLVLRVGSFASRKRAARAGVFQPLGRDTAVVVTDGRRKAPASVIVVSTETPEQYDAMESLLDDAGVLLLNVPPHMGLMVRSAYVAVLDVDDDRLTDIGEDTSRDWTLPYVEVAMPVGGVPSTSWTWADVMSNFETWADVMAANRTWADLMDPTA